MLYMTIFWIIMLLDSTYYYARKGNKNSNVSDTCLVILFIASSFLIVAIVTRDPLFSSFGVPQEFEWIVGLFIAALGSWRLYFGPFNKRMMTLEKDVHTLKSDMHLIKEYIFAKG